MRFKLSNYEQESGSQILTKNAKLQLRETVEKSVPAAADS